MSSRQRLPASAGHGGVAQAPMALPGTDVPGRGFDDQDEAIARPRALLTVRACWWAIGELRREHASVQGLACRLGTTWRTVWSSIRPLAIDDQLEDARSVLDAFHVVKLATKVVDDVRRRVQQEIHGHRGRRDDPLYRIRNNLRAGRENLTERQRARREQARAADERHVEVEVAWLCAQQVRDAYHQDSHAAGRAIAEKVLASFTTCPIPEVKRLGKTLNQWRREFLGYFDTDGANNGGTEAVNGLIELHRRIARGFRNLKNYRLRMLLIADGLNL